jgi:hypothetical protein
MLARSFRLDTARLIPQGRGAKQTLLLATLILAGCGGSAQAKSQVVTGPGFQFSAPSGWHIATSAARASASHATELVQVSTFRLVKPYRDALFARVARELEVRMQTLAGQMGGKVAGSETVTAGGIRSHSYRVDVGGDVVTYTFVLRDRHEYELLCRNAASSSGDACTLLLKTFAPS